MSELPFPVAMSIYEAKSYDAIGRILSSYSALPCMALLRGQGTTQSCCGTTYRHLGQGATEYLVLLAVVLIVALVSVALLGFFPGMAADAQITQSQTYWQGAQPISIVESAARYSSVDTSDGYLRLRNNGAYQITITRIWGNGANITQFWNSSGYFNISTVLYLSPGAEATLGWAPIFPGLVDARQIGFALPTGGTGWGRQALKGADSVCASSKTGTVVVKDLGFEYIEYVEGQQITKRQTGRPFITKCIG